MNLYEALFVTLCIMMTYQLHNVRVLPTWSKDKQGEAIPETGRGR
jgi:hypothetical protein